MINDIPEVVKSAIYRHNSRVKPHPRNTTHLCIIIDAIGTDALVNMLEIMIDKIKEPDILNNVGGIGGWASDCSWALLGEENTDAIKKYNDSLESICANKKAELSKI